jgi:mRNA interferase RelE/StbE
MRLLVSSRADRDLRRLPPDLLRRVVAALRALAQDPRPPGCLMLRGPSPLLWRIRVGDWRITYEIDDDAAEVRVMRVLHRGDRDYGA